MPEQVKAWYDRRWLVPTLAILAFVSAPFNKDIRDAVLDAVGITLGDWLFDVLLAGGLIGLAVVLRLKSARAARASEALRQKLQQDLAKHRQKLQEDLANHRKELQQDLATLVDSRLKPITDGVGTLKSNVSALDSRLGALDSKMTALESGMTAVKDKLDGSNEKP